jgi:hypothetical protein
MSLNNKYRVSTTLKLILIFVFHVFILTAQTKGLVFDEKSEKPLAGVNIVSLNGKVVGVTNREGTYNLKNMAGMTGNDTLSFSHLGYVTRKIPFNGLKEKQYVVSLSEVDQLLREVTVVSSKVGLQHEIKYKKLKSLKEGLYSFGSTVVGDKICIIGGDASFGEDQTLKALSDYGDDVLSHLKLSFSWQEFSGKLYVYDLPSDRWTTSGLKFSKRAYHNIHYVKGKIYVLGGKTISRDGRAEYLDNQIEVYNVRKNTILEAHSNPHAAIDFASFAYGDNLIVMGGSTKIKSNGEKEYSKKVHLCNLKTGYWYELDDMPEAMETKGVMIGNTIYLIGGYNTVPLKQMQSYNVESGRWKDEGQLMYEVARPALATLGDMIYIFEDGRIQTYNVVTKEIKVYLIDLALKSSELFYANDKLYLLGGYEQDDYSFSPSSNLYSIDLNEFKRTETQDAP